MEINVIDQLMNQMKILGIETCLFGYPYLGEDTFNTGLRGIVEKEYDINADVVKINEYFEDNIIYMAKDNYNECFVSFRLPMSQSRIGKTDFIQIGPYLTSFQEEVVDKVMERNHLEPIWRNELLEYYNGIPLIHDVNLLEMMIKLQVQYIFGFEIRLTILRLEEYYGQHFDAKKLLENDEKRISMQKIAERYQYEDVLIDAVKNGDLEKVAELNQVFCNYRLRPRGEDSLREVKNMVIIQNTLFRKAVQAADVHPAHIDQISASFARKIEASAHKKELEDLSHDLARKYCLLVRNYSLRGSRKLFEMPSTILILIINTKRL